jgi:hypothetical protein
MMKTLALDELAKCMPQYTETALEILETCTLSENEPRNRSQSIS